VGSQLRGAERAANSLAGVTHCRLQAVD